MIGCAPDVGECNQERALALVYDFNGQPAYEGQALIIQSCGAGGFCHADDIEPELRYGAPAGMELDLRHASLTPDVNEDAVQRLAVSQANAHFHATEIWNQVANGDMPPQGVGRTVLEAAPLFRRVPEGEIEGTPVPGLDDEGGTVDTTEGREILRNWLACGAPVVERVLERDDGFETTVGDVRPVIEAPPVEPVWSEIYSRIVFRSCAFSNCHDGETAAGELDLSTEEGALSALLDVPAAGELCDDGPGGEVRVRVVPGNPEESLLIQKLTGITPTGPVCGDRMPTAGTMLSEQRIETFREWISGLQ